MDAAGTRGREAHAQFPGPFGIAAGHEGRALLVPHLHETDLVLTRPERLHDPVDPVARQAEDDLDLPIQQCFNERIGSGASHGNLRRMEGRSVEL